MISIKEPRKFVPLSLVGVVLAVLLAVSMAGVSYSSVISSVTNTNNSLSFIPTHSHVEPHPDNTEEYIEPLNPEYIEVEIDGESSILTSYDITPAENLSQNQELSFNLNGKFCIFLDINKKFTFSINEIPFDIKGKQLPAQGYYTIVDGDLLKAKGSTYEEQLQFIVTNKLWIPSDPDEPAKFAFHQHDTNAGSTPLKFVFAPTET